MSTYRFAAIDCPRCDLAVQVRSLEGMHISWLPHVRAEVLDRRFQRLRCPGCQLLLHVEAPAVYFDDGRGHYIAIAPTVRTGAAHAEVEAHRRAFDQALTNGPPIAQDIGRVMRHRVVADHEALREKLVLWDAGLDDHAVECAKGRMQQQVGIEPGTEVWRVEEVLPGGHLLCRADDGRVEVVPQIELPADREAAVEEFPWLGDDWLVDVALGAVGRKGVMTLEDTRT